MLLSLSLSKERLFAPPVIEVVIVVVFVLVGELPLLFMLLLCWCGGLCGLGVDDGRDRIEDDGRGRDLTKFIHWFIVFGTFILDLDLWSLIIWIISLAIWLSFKSIKNIYANAL